jgi:hypothetical protein
MSFPAKSANGSKSVTDTDSERVRRRECFYVGQDRVHAPALIDPIMFRRAYSSASPRFRVSIRSCRMHVGLRLGRSSSGIFVVRQAVSCRPLLQQRLKSSPQSLFVPSSRIRYFHAAVLLVETCRQKVGTSAVGCTPAARVCRFPSSRVRSDTADGSVAANCRRGAGTTKPPVTAVVGATPAYGLSPAVSPSDRPAASPAQASSSLPARAFPMGSAWVDSQQTV